MKIDEQEIEMALLAEAAYHNPEALTPLDWETLKEYQAYRKRLEHEYRKEFNNI